VLERYLVLPLTGGPYYPKSSSLRSCLRQHEMHVLTGGCVLVCTADVVQRWHLRGKWHWDATEAIAFSAGHEESIPPGCLSNAGYAVQFQLQRLKR
jgi:hypothetical protein